MVFKKDYNAFKQQVLKCKRPCSTIIESTPLKGASAPNVVQLANEVFFVKSTCFRSEEDSHVRSINIHKVMCVYVTCNNS